MFPAYANSKITNHQVKAIVTTCLKFPLKGTDVWFDEISPKLPNIIIINIESEKIYNSCELVGKRNRGRKFWNKPQLLNISGPKTSLFL